MADLSLPIYDNPRKWIADSRRNEISWEEIELGRKKDYAGLQAFLSQQVDINFWPEMSITEWQQLVFSSSLVLNNFFECVSVIPLYFLAK